MSEGKKVNVLKNKPWPPENKPKPKETVHLPRKTKKAEKTEKRTDENINQTKPKETELSPRKTKIMDKDEDEKRTEGNVIQEEPLAAAEQTTTKETQTDEDEYLIPLSTRDAQNIASDEYIRVNVGMDGPSNVAATFSENIVEVNTPALTDAQNLHVHIHISPQQTEQSNSRWKVTINQNSAETAGPPPPPPPRTPQLPPRPPSIALKKDNRQSKSKSKKDEHHKESEETSGSSDDSSDSSKGEIDVQEILKDTPREGKYKQVHYDEVDYGANAPKEESASQSTPKWKDVPPPPPPPIRPRWLFKYTDRDEADESVQTDKNGSFAVIQENEEEMPFSPYTLIVVHNGQLKRLPIMKQGGGILGGKDKLVLGNSKPMKSVEDLVSFFQKNYIGTLNLKLLPLK